MGEGVTEQHTFADVGAIVHRFDVAGFRFPRRVGVDVDGGEELADAVERFEFLGSEEVRHREDFRGRAIRVEDEKESRGRDGTFTGFAILSA